CARGDYGNSLDYW
nr:immunoglobulin heavy chain junction region [Macaca mulatta]MOX59757.1 immunoglobulin heavy chain junction region [Macaca mulatta]MOX59952.1 immunoglobulin heavy chain junction region [Macaca mulatta]MOX60628.1 immunoglobulin heavy chain junction region [Macaca mulatta]MOX60770.1 immunoglobulin heavy chain junction region [Macaca mulatta]